MRLQRKDRQPITSYRSVSRSIRFGFSSIELGWGLRAFSHFDLFPLFSLFFSFFHYLVFIFFLTLHYLFFHYSFFHHLFFLFFFTLHYLFFHYSFFHYLFFHYFSSPVERQLDVVGFGWVGWMTVAEGEKNKKQSRTGWFVGGTDSMIARRRSVVDSIDHASFFFRFSFSPQSHRTVAICHCSRPSPSPSPPAIRLCALHCAAWPLSGR